jgi:hypothetical protein
VAAERVVVIASDAPTPFSWRPTFTNLGPVPQFDARSHSPPPRGLLPARAPPV